MTYSRIVGTGSYLPEKVVSNKDLELTIDTSAPAGPVTVDSLVSNDTTPVLTGTATLGAGESLTVTVSGATYSVTADGSGDYPTIQAAVVESPDGEP